MDAITDGMEFSEPDNRAPECGVLCAAENVGVVLLLLPMRMLGVAMVLTVVLRVGAVEMVFFVITRGAVFVGSGKLLAGLSPRGSGGGSWRSLGRLSRFSFLEVKPLKLFPLWLKL